MDGQQGTYAPSEIMFLAVNKPPGGLCDEAQQLKVINDEMLEKLKAQEITVYFTSSTVTVWFIWVMWFLC